MTTRSWQWARPTGSRTDELPTRPSARWAGRDGSIALVSWVRSSINRVNLEALRDHARESILDVNDGITSAAGIAEGFISAGASTRTLLFAGTAVILAGGSAAAGARFSEARIQCEMDRALLEAERALGPTSGAVLAALTAGLCYGIGAAVPLAAMTGLPVIRLVRRNIVLGSAVMVAGILVGLALD